jgi:Flp pilus assembly CpaE family ATPase
VHVLLSPAGVDACSDRSPSFDNLANFLQACKSAYGYTVIDAPRISMDAAVILANSSAVTFICFQLTVKDIRLTRTIISGLKENGIPPDLIYPLVNRYERRNQVLGLSEGQDALGGVTIECIGNDYRSALKGANYGQPLAQAAPRSILRKDLQTLVTRISQLQDSSRQLQVKHGTADR